MGRAESTRDDLSEATECFGRYVGRHGGNAYAHLVLGTWCAINAAVDQWTRRLLGDGVKAALKGTKLPEWQPLPLWVRGGLRWCASLAAKHYVPVVPLLTATVLDQVCGDPPLLLFRRALDVYRLKFSGNPKTTSIVADLLPFKHTILDVFGTEQLLVGADDDLHTGEAITLVLWIARQAQNLDTPTRAIGHPTDPVAKAFHDAVVNYYHAHGICGPTPTDLAELSVAIGMDAERASSIRKWCSRLNSYAKKAS